MLATLSLVIRHEALARRGETIYKKNPYPKTRGFCILKIVTYAVIQSLFFLNINMRSLIPAMTIELYRKISRVISIFSFIL